MSKHATCLQALKPRTAVDGQRGKRQRAVGAADAPGVDEREQLRRSASDRRALFRTRRGTFGARTGSLSAAPKIGTPKTATSRSTSTVTFGSDAGAGDAASASTVTGRGFNVRRRSATPRGCNGCAALHRAFRSTGRVGAAAGARSDACVERARAQAAAPRNGCAESSMFPPKRPATSAAQQTRAAERPRSVACGSAPAQRTARASPACACHLSTPQRAVFPSHAHAKWLYGACASRRRRIRRASASQPRRAASSRLATRSAPARLRLRRRRARRRAGAVIERTSPRACVGHAPLSQCVSDHAPPALLCAAWRGGP